MVVQFIVFLTLSTLICRSTDISKCFSESLGIRDNESRLYLLKQSDTLQTITDIFNMCMKYVAEEIIFVKTTAFFSRSHILVTLDYWVLYALR